MRAKYACISALDVTDPDSIASASSGMLFSTTSTGVVRGVCAPMAAAAAATATTAKRMRVIRGGPSIARPRDATLDLWETVQSSPPSTVTHLDHLGDFTTTRRVIPISVLAIIIGIFAAFVAAALLKLIGLFTNLFFFQRVDTALVSPAGHHLGPFVVLVPVAGALVIGVMARYGSERIRGHGIPEAIEAILINGSRVEPKVALLKPLSAAISVGSGGPFGAEGPIILTGGFSCLLSVCFFSTPRGRSGARGAWRAGGRACRPLSGRPSPRFCLRWN